VAEVASPRPLSEGDRCEHFDCGQESINAWFRRHAWHNHVSGVSRVSVICDSSSGLIAGFATLSASQIEREFLAKAHRRNKPDPVPATLHGQLAIHRPFQGQGHARSLLLFALTTALRASREVGSFGVITHPINEEIRAFYRRWGFEDLPFDPQRAMIVRMIELENNKFIG
jgi:GNAT superfamily N-acetyltransferase